MKKIYHTHQSSNGMAPFYYDEDYFVCDTEEEYKEQRKKYEAKSEWAKKDYSRRGHANYTPVLSEEKKIHASEYFYGHEWRGKNFDAIGFSWTLRDSFSSETTYILKPSSVKGLTLADNSACAGVYYGS